MNSQFVVDQFDTKKDSADIQIQRPELGEIHSDIKTALPPLSTNTIIENPVKKSQNPTKIINIAQQVQVQVDNIKRIDNLINYPVPSLTPQNTLPNTNSNTHKNNEDLNTSEPSVLYSNLTESTDTESSPNATPPNLLTPKTPNSENNGFLSTEMVIDTGFVVHDKPIPAFTRKEIIRKPAMTKIQPQGPIQIPNLNTTNQNAQTTAKPIKITTKRAPKSAKTEEEKKAVADALDKLLTSNEIPPEHLQHQVHSFLRKELIHATMQEDYSRASELESASVFLSTAFELQASETKKNQSKQFLNERFNNIKNAYEQEASEWQKIFEIYREQQQVQQEKLEEMHRKELEEFEQKWSNSESMTKFNKPSSSLLYMRRMQKKLAIAHQFEEALKIKQEADELQNNEADEAQKKAEEAMIIEYDNLIEKHNRTIECFQAHQRSTEVFLKTEQGRILQPLENQMKHFQNLINKDKPTNLKPTTYKFLSTTKSRLAAAELTPSSPRTLGKYTSFKTIDKAQKLNVNGLDVRRIIRKKRGHAFPRNQSKS